jgi:hypothetical protein
VVASTGFFLIGLAASIGAVRFASQPTELASAHSLLSLYASQVGVPLLCLSFTLNDPDYFTASPWAFLVSSTIILTALFIVFRFAIRLELYSIIIAVLVMLPVLSIGVRNSNTFAMLAVLAYVIAGIGFKDNVEVFHYILCLGHVFFTLALKRIEQSNRRD